MISSISVRVPRFKKYPKATLATVEKVQSAAGVISYEMVVKQGGKDTTIEVDTKGKIKVE